MKRHLEAIRGVERWAHVPILLVVENNMGNEAVNLGTYAQSLELGVHRFCARRAGSRRLRQGGAAGGGGGVPILEHTDCEGIRTDAFFKETAFTYVRELLQKDAIRLHSKWSTCSGDRKQVLDKLATHMMRIRRFEKVHDSGRVTVSFTGKLDADGKMVEGQNDDLSMTLALGIGVFRAIVYRQFTFDNALRRALNLRVGGSVGDL